MSLKTDIEMVKDELSSEEMFFEKAVITERFIKKYKKVMIGSVIAIVVVVAANIAYNLKNENRIEAANTALAILQNDSNNAQALNDLKSLSNSLYEVYLYSNAVTNKDGKSLAELTKSKTPMISDLASYELAQDSKSLEEYALKQDAVFKELALVQSAVMLINSGNTDEAHKKLMQIAQTSSLSSVAKSLLHYGVK